MSGSGASGSNREESDIDIAFLSSAKTSGLDRYNAAQDIAWRLKRDVDLIDLGVAGDVLRYEVVTKGVLIFGDSDASENYAVRVMRDYMDHKSRVADIQREIMSVKQHD